MLVLNSGLLIMFLGICLGVMLTLVVSKANKARLPEQVSAAVPVSAAATPQNLKDDRELVAAITAALSVYLGTSDNRIIIRSITKPVARVM